MICSSILLLICRKSVKLYILSPTSPHIPPYPPISPPLTRPMFPPRHLNTPCWSFSDSCSALPLQDICREATNKWGAMTAVNMIGDLKQKTAAGCVPLAKDSGQDKEAEVVATDCHGFSCPRKVTGCQHVAASGQPMVLNGMQDMAARGFASPEDWASASKHDPEGLWRLRGAFGAVYSMVCPTGCRRSGEYPFNLWFGVFCILTCLGKTLQP